MAPVPMAPWQVVPPGVYPPPAQPAGRASPLRLTALFAIILVIGLAASAAAILALQRGPGAPPCPDPRLPCGQPTARPTLPPVADTPAPTGPAPTASARPARSTPRPPSSSNIALNLPDPQPPTNAEPLRTGVRWTSGAFGFAFQYNPNIWVVESEGPNGVVLSSWQGQIHVAIEGFDPSTAPATLIQQKIESLRGSVLGLSPETDPGRQAPGRPIIGFRQGEAEFLIGTMNTPQGPTTSVDVAIMAATDGQVAIRATLLTTDSLRDAAFYYSDALLNAVRWPADR